MPKSGDIPVCPTPPAARSSGRVTKEYQISLITPLFGGRVEAGAPDETLPIRGTSIRGQLHFWWRATRGSGFMDHKQLFARHSDIWGKTDRASPVEIEVRDVKASPMQSCARYDWNQNARGGNGGWRLALPYALFPFQGKQPASRDGDPEEPPAKFAETASFALRLRYPQKLAADIAADIEAAVWAWANFGGLGARTRRGCGALHCRELAPKDLDDLRQRFETFSVNSEGIARDWPTIPASVLAGDQEMAPVDAWKKVVGLLQSFRQGSDIGRNPGTQRNRPGRSRWPESETIRRVTDRRPSQHARLAHIPDDAFPRAEFGLPIVFHFQGQGEPPDTVLYPSNAPNRDARERMASPLILKPLALANGKAVPLIVRLVTLPLAGVVLKQCTQSLDLPRTTAVRDGRLATYRDSPLARSASGSAVEAFLQYARENGFREITW